MPETNSEGELHAFTSPRTHSSPIMNRYDSCFNPSLLASCFVSPPGLMWHSERDFEPLFNMSAFQQAIIKASIQQYEDLKLPRSSQPIISLRAGLKILIQTSMPTWDHLLRKSLPSSRVCTYRHQRTDLKWLNLEVIIIELTVLLLLIPYCSNCHLF